MVFSLPVIHSYPQRAYEFLVPGELGCDDRKNMPVVFLHDSKHEQSLLLQSRAELEECGFLILQWHVGPAAQTVSRFFRGSKLIAEKGIKKRHWSLCEQKTRIRALFNFTISETGRGKKGDKRDLQELEKRQVERENGKGPKRCWEIQTTSETAQQEEWLLATRGD